MMLAKHFWQLFVFLLPTFMKIPRRNCVSLIGRTSSCLAWRSSQGANKPYPFEEQMRPSCHSIFSFVCPNPFLGYWQAPFFCPQVVFLPPRGGATRVGASISAQHALPCTAVLRAFGIALLRVLRRFLWGISIVSLGPHSLGHPSLRIPSAWEM